MNGLAEELKNKDVRICFQAEHYIGGGVAAADYAVMGGVDGFLKLRNERGQTVYCRIDQIRRITVRSAPDDGGTI